MGFKITRQRYYTENQLAVEICSGTKYIGKDVLTTRYKDLGESKYLVSPIDAVKCGIRVVKRWHIDYHDEVKRIALVNFDGKGTKEYFDPANDRDMKRLEDTGTKLLNSMSKCGNCQRPMGTSSNPFVSDDIPNMEFCDENCGANKYRDMFKAEMPKPKSITAGKHKKP